MSEIDIPMMGDGPDGDEYLFARIATLEASLAAVTTDRDRMVEALREIARQHIGDEIEDEEAAEFRDGYEMCVLTARAALTNTEDRT